MPLNSQSINTNLHEDTPDISELVQSNFEQQYIPPDDQSCALPDVSVFTFPRYRHFCPLCPPMAMQQQDETSPIFCLEAIPHPNQGLVKPNLPSPPPLKTFQMTQTHNYDIFCKQYIEIWAPHADASGLKGSHDSATMTPLKSISDKESDCDIWKHFEKL